MRTLIAGGTVVSATDVVQADLLIDGERIAAVGRDLCTLGVQADRTLDATGLLVLPGGVDVHTHLDMPAGELTSADDFYTGTVAAAMGGTTTIVDFAEQERGRGQSLYQVLELWHERAGGKAVIDYGFHAVISELLPGTLEEMRGLIRAGVTSFKLFMAYPGSLMLDDGAIFQIMQQAAASGGMVTLHAENGHVIDVLIRQALARGMRSPRAHALTRPVLAESEAVYRALALGEMAGCPVYIVHVSTGDAAAHIRAARGRGLPVHGETCPQYLFLSDEVYDTPDFRQSAGYVMSPPLRSQEHRGQLWRALAGRDLEVVATDHCPFCLHHKELGRDDFTRIPNGAPGIEHRLSLIYDAGVATDRITLQQFVQITAAGPARLFGLYPRKGSLAPGADADLVLFDPRSHFTIRAAEHHMRVDYNPYEGRVVRGVPRVVLCRGQVVARDGRFVGKAGAGRFQRRSSYSG